ncbi:formylglycine-generating enzyme family protein [Phyllobacterium sp. 0TCS1.6C]|uniref:formylglycine-generating enzyme family protein n=1 Tax=unclassified Phyllobacterium TaxID=2638441 RepID=UPI0022642D01|nr:MULTISPECIES: formylglycine-generating enzyme family protein [unclassified Phyllobacterium]MCX8282045.1 formylglycine-generating enzyme family protein [Phyllobacterium sp. 0TCS1.6C]MCX8296263.1 formylglycine-generating enzyme family protein [Phyllobacterium sp. 0TCS1.6A]
MSCCSDFGARRGQLDVGRPQSAPVSVGTASAVARARFHASRSHVGTDRPLIHADGEGPRKAVKLAPFELETVAVTNSRFAAFVAATGYTTEAEKFGWAPVFEGLLPISASRFPVSPHIPWWHRVDGACWHSPEGPGSSIHDRADHPVVQVSWWDATAFATWSGGRLPTEAEWEHAARGGLADPRFPWGDEEPNDGEVFCNIWQGRFPDHNTVEDGFAGTAPVDAFAPNGKGLFNMAGNVWEWTADAFRIRSLSKAARQRNDQAGRDDERVMKGGSFLCHKSYCYRYRIAARTAASANSSASNIGFRICYDLPRYGGS